MSEDIFQLVDGSCNAASSNFVHYCVGAGLATEMDAEWKAYHYTAHAQLLRERHPDAYTQWLALWRLGVRKGAAREF